MRGFSGIRFVPATRVLFDSLFVHTALGCEVLLPMPLRASVARGCCCNMSVTQLAVVHYFRFRPYPPIPLLLP
jgi:hypothetical protein